MAGIPSNGSGPRRAGTRCRARMEMYPHGQVEPPAFSADLRCAVARGPWGAAAAPWDSPTPGGHGPPAGGSGPAASGARRRGGVPIRRRARPHPGLGPYRSGNEPRASRWRVLSPSSSRFRILRSRSDTSSAGGKGPDALVGPEDDLITGGGSATHARRCPILVDGYRSMAATETGIRGPIEFISLARPGSGPRELGGGHHPLQVLVEQRYGECRVTVGRAVDHPLPDQL